MKASLDTNVLVAAAIEDHPHHVPAFELLKAIQQKRLRGCISTHGQAEFYSVISRAPFRPRVHPIEAGRMLEENIVPYFEVVVLTAEDYQAVLHSCAAAGLIGGVIFDALHLYSSEKANCDRIYTFNVKDFRMLAQTEEVIAMIASP